VLEGRVDDGLRSVEQPRLGCGEHVDKNWIVFALGRLELLADRLPCVGGGGGGLNPASCGEVALHIALSPVWVLQLQAGSRRSTWLAKLLSAQGIQLGVLSSPDDDVVLQALDLLGVRGPLTTDGDDRLAAT